MTRRKNKKSPYPIDADDVFAFITEGDRVNLDKVCDGLSEHMCAVAHVFLHSYTETVMRDRRLGGAHYKNGLEVLNLVEGLHETIIDGMLQFLDGSGVAEVNIELVTAWMVQVHSTITSEGVLMLTISVLSPRTARKLRKQSKIIVPYGHYLRS